MIEIEQWNFLAVVVVMFIYGAPILILIGSIAFFSVSGELSAKNFIERFYARSEKRSDNIKLYIFQGAYLLVILICIVFFLVSYFNGEM